MGSKRSLKGEATGMPGHFSGCFVMNTGDYMKGACRNHCILHGLEQFDFASCKVLLDMWYLRNQGVDGIEEF